MEGNLICDKTVDFSGRIIRLYKYLLTKNEYVLSRQILRCGTSIGANVEEAIGGQSRRDFYAKICIAYKEARETAYWLKVLKNGEYIDNKGFVSMFNDCDEICRILAKIKMSTNNS
jgi:four helix bundle protein